MNLNIFLIAFLGTGWGIVMLIIDAAVRRQVDWTEAGEQLAYILILSLLALGLATGVAFNVSELAR